MKEIDFNKLPRHIAIIMDGNGRWAEKHKFGRIVGHQRGARSVRTIVRACREIGIKYLTLYALSVENLFRPQDEVNALMALLEKYLRSELPELIDKNIRFTTIGNIDVLNDSVKRVLNVVTESTVNNKGMVLNLALSYGGRDEIVHAVNNILVDYKDGKINKNGISKESFSKYLYTSGMPDPDLLIRTSGEYRVSNFLLWQSAYTEFYFTDV